ncbi:MAG: LysM peptidoglycan-binding domain-containing protein [Caldilineaceae bacterium]|nr:LysM peptidoglycan-binding domain-containing protein [Caldilineaceae bacterium]
MGLLHYETLRISTDPCSPNQPGDLPVAFFAPVGAAHRFPKADASFPLSVLAFFVAISLLFVPAYAHSARAQSLTHRVQYGESLSAIAARYGVSAQTLASTNGIYNVNMIRVGQVLVIPGRSNRRRTAIRRRLAKVMPRPPRLAIAAVADMWCGQAIRFMA